jgi:hypothetical protein
MDSQVTMSAKVVSFKKALVLATGDAERAMAETAETCYWKRFATGYTKNNEQNSNTR